MRVNLQARIAYLKEALTNRGNESVIPKSTTMAEIAYLEFQLLTLTNAELFLTQFLKQEKKHHGRGHERVEQIAQTILGLERIRNGA